MVDCNTKQSSCGVRNFLTIRQTGRDLNYVQHVWKRKHDLEYNVSLVHN